MVCVRLAWGDTGHVTGDVGMKSRGRVAAPSQWSLILLAGILGCASVVPGLSNGYWRDEAATATVAVRSWGQVVGLLPHAEGGFAGYELFIHAWSDVFGAGEFSLRAPSLLATFGTIVVGGVLAGRLGSRWAGPVTAAILALHPMLVPFYGMEARGYALGAFFTCVAALAAHRAACGERRVSTPTFAVAATLAISMNFMLVLAVAPLLVWVITDLRADRRRAQWLALPVAVACTLYLLTDRDSSLQSWLTRPSLRDVLVVGGQTLTPAMAIFASALAVAAFLTRGKTRSAQGDFVLACAGRRDLAVLGLWAVAPAAFLLVYSVLLTPAFLARYVISSVVPLAILTALALDAVLDRAQAVRSVARVRSLAASIVLVVGAVAMIAASVLQGSLRPAPKAEDLRAAARYLAAHRQSGDALLFAPTWAELDLRHYIADNPVGAVPPNLARLSGATAARADSLFSPTPPADVVRRRLDWATRVWIVGYPRVPAYAPAPDPDSSIASTIRSCWHEVLDRPVGVDMELQLWERATVTPKGGTCPSSE